MRKFLQTLSFFFFISATVTVAAQTAPVQDTVVKKKKNNPKIIYGTASFYANKFNGRKTATGEIFSQQKMTAACNVLPLGTWIKVTNIRNGRSVIVKINDRLHPKMKRVVDLSKIAAQKLNYVNSGLTKVKVEVLGKKKPSE
jgi:rare lipoprotein A